MLYIHLKATRCTPCELPDDLEDTVEVRLDLFDGLRQQPTIRSDANVGHPVDRHQGLQQPAQRVQRGVTCLEEVELWGNY